MSVAAAGEELCWGAILFVAADVAQLVEHFTRNEGVRGSNPRVGFLYWSQIRLSLPRPLFRPTALSLTSEDAAYERSPL